MSRFDGPTEPDFDRYEPKPHDPQDDLNMPDFDAPDVGVYAGSPLAVGAGQTGKTISVTASIDPAEHAMHSLIDALTTLEQQIVLAPSLERLNALRKLTKRAEQHATLVNNKCADAIDRAMERIR